MLRDARRMINDPLGYLGGCVRRHGHVVAFPLPRTAVWLVDDPQAVRRVLQDNHRNYTKRTAQYDALGLVTGDGLLVSDPPEWRHNRRLMQPAFHHRTLPGVAAHSVSAAGRASADWEGTPDGTVVDVDAAMMRLTLEVVGSALFSTDLSEDATRLVSAVLAALDAVVVRARSPWLPPLRVPTPGNRRLRRALRTLDEAVQAMVERRRARGGPADDVLAMLLSSGLPDDAVRNETVTLVVAGHETVASALTWTWHLLATHPGAQGRLHAELGSVLGGRPPQWSDLPALTWTRAVIDESLRLYPPAWVVSRRALERDRLAGYDLPAGALVIMSPYVLHRHEQAWPEADRFDPGRWLGTAPARAERQAYIPFGAGPRLCIGRDFALVETTLVLAALAQRFSFDPAQEPCPEALVTIRPRGGLLLRLRRR